MLRLSSTVSQCLCHRCCRFNIQTIKKLNQLIRKERMAVWDKKISCCFTLLLAGALGQRVNYPRLVCGVKGSTVTLPCSFNTLKSVVDDVGEPLIRVIWCKGPNTCGREAPAVYDSESQNNNPRYRYLGDKKGDCTLQISDLQEEDEATLRFRVEANDRRATFTAPVGVRVMVIGKSII
ncbi:hypothetical protein EPR50_G00058460 [Perca flavescens]|uniref:Immunoglobulin domain-containing protein n=1 Tax=Perca flavescens TaxID=8167 RepID=A0A484D9D3_PERFV|nr:hypothetical protein EPR50_G00058460 [Perca flavescens]